MMKTEDGSYANANSYNSEISEPKKVKLMYTSEFLKSFDRAPKPNTLLSLEDLEFDSKKTPRGGDRLREREMQILELTQLVFKLKELIVENKDEHLIAKMKEIITESGEGQQFLSGSANGHKLPSLRIATDSDQPSMYHSILSPHTPSAASVTFAGVPAPLSARSPRVDATSAPPGLPPLNLAPLSGSPPPTSINVTPVTPGSAGGLPRSESSKSVQLRSPRRTDTKTGSSGAGAGGKAWPSAGSPGSLGAPSAIPVSAPPSSGNLLSAGNAKNAAGSSEQSNKGLMKRSPSMPVIPNERKSGNTDMQAQLKLQKKTKSIEDFSDQLKKGGNNKDDKNKSGSISARNNSSNNNNPDPVSPRKGIKKSVSMSAISAENDEKAAALKCTSLEEIVGQIYPLTKYQAGCRFLQKKLEEQPDPQHVTLVFNEVFDHLIELMTDPYGQYLVPKLMKHCDKTQRQAIVTKIAPKIVTFACHTYGIHGVQKILEYLTDDQVKTFVDVIRPSVIHLAKDGKGNYLIQSFLKQFPAERNQFIYDAIISHCVEVATHKVGCTLINRCIDYSNEQQLTSILKQIAANCMVMVQDQFGNYVVQHILATKPNFAPIIIRAMLGHIAELSVQKFSSNVIEKCLQVAVNVEPDLYTSIIKEIADANLLELLQDRYANFVIQTALDVADDVQHAKLVKLILPYIHQIKTPYVMHIQKKILQV